MNGIVAAIIVAGIGGLPVSAATELLKRFVNVGLGVVGKSVGYICSALVSMGATYMYLDATSMLTVWTFLGYSFLTFLFANGYFKEFGKKS